MGEDAANDIQDRLGEHIATLLNASSVGAGVSSGIKETDVNAGNQPMTELP